MGLKSPEGKEEYVHLMKKARRAIKDNLPKVEIVTCGCGNHKKGGTIDLSLIPEIAPESEAEIALPDTGMRNGVSLTRFTTLDNLSDFIEKTRALGAQAALAGSFDLKEISKLKSLKRDVIGVRGSLCKNEGRNQGIASEIPVDTTKKTVGGLNCES